MTFTIKLAQANGTPAKPRSFKSTVLAWNPGDRIPISPGRTLQVVRVRHHDAAELLVLVVEDLSQRASSAEPGYLVGFGKGRVGGSAWRSTATRPQNTSQTRAHAGSYDLLRGRDGAGYELFHRFTARSLSSQMKRRRVERKLAVVELGRKRLEFLRR